MKKLEILSWLLLIVIAIQLRIHTKTYKGYHKICNITLIVNVILFGIISLFIEFHNIKTYASLHSTNTYRNVETGFLSYSILAFGAGRKLKIKTLKLAMYAICILLLSLSIYLSFTYDARFVLLTKLV